MRLSRDDYRRAEGCLRRYNYNCITIINIRTDIMSVGAANYDPMPKAPYSISDSVFNQYVKLQEDRELQKALKEYRVVRQVYELLNKDCKDVFDTYYQKQKSKWETMEILGLSERTFLRRKKDLIYTIDKELKKMA